VFTVSGITSVFLPNRSSGSFYFFNFKQNLLIILKKLYVIN